MFGTLTVGAELCGNRDRRTCFSLRHYQNRSPLIMYWSATKQQQMMPRFPSTSLRIHNRGRLNIQCYSSKNREISLNNLRIVPQKQCHDKCGVTMRTNSSYVPLMDSLQTRRSTSLKAGCIMKLPVFGTTSVEGVGLWWGKSVKITGAWRSGRESEARLCGIRFCLTGQCEM